ncbi:kelch domain-containing protein 10-like isoform X2 [Asterias amurensis]|uniref:kelch domain-containing protein 10-like isoform X2 n=1 Tax=Asterias amurensis TaxID=7602 RepID=UPI003AB8F0BC
MANHGEQLSAACPLINEIKVGEAVISKSRFSTRSVDQPYPRSGHCCATDGINFYIYGGYHPEYHIPKDPEDSDDEDEVVVNEIFQEMWSFNIATETWQKVETVGRQPTETASMSMLLCGQNMLLFGGTGYPWGKNPNADVFIFNLSEKSWSIMECTGDERPPGKYGQAMVLHDNKLYFHGGCRMIDNPLTNRRCALFDSTVYCLDAGSKTWSQLATSSDTESDTKKGMYRHGLAWHDGNLYLIGSSDNKEAPMKDKKYLDEVFQPHKDKENRWTVEKTKPCPKGAYPAPRKHHSCVQWKNEVYICGGHNDEVIFDDVWRLELPSLQWFKLPTALPVPTCFHTAAITPETSKIKCMYIFGGLISDITDPDYRQRKRTNNVFRIWLDIPPLADISLRKIVSCLPDVTDETIATLSKLGVQSGQLDKLRHDKCR